VLEALGKNLFLKYWDKLEFSHGMHHKKAEPVTKGHD